MTKPSHRVVSIPTALPTLEAAMVFVHSLPPGVSYIILALGQPDDPRFGVITFDERGRLVVY